MHRLEERGAEYDVDYDFTELLELSKLAIISDAPPFRLPSDILNFPPTSGPSVPFGVPSYDNTAYGTRAAMRNRLNLALFGEQPHSAQSCLDSLGGKFSDAATFAVRANSVIDMCEAQPEGALPEYPPIRQFFFHRMLATPRTFDAEHPKSVAVLNGILDQMVSTGLLYNFRCFDAGRGVVKEQDSRRADALQAADIAAGVARDVIERQGMRALAGRFRRVVVNGMEIADWLS